MKRTKPIRWNERFGWRRFCAVERLGYFHFWREVGRRMNIRDIPADYDTFERLNREYERRHYRFTDASQRVGAATRELFVRWFPAVLAPVVRPVIHRDVRLSSLYDDLAASGRAPDTTVLAHESCTPATADVPGLADLLPPDEPLQMVRRLRRADGEPLAIMTNYLPARYELDDVALAGRSLYDLLRDQGAQIAIAHQTIGARLADAAEADLLEQPRPLACVTAERIVYDDAGALVELGRHLYRADRYTVQTSLVV